MDEHFKLGSLTPKEKFYYINSLLDEHFKLGSLTPKGVAGYFKDLLDEHFKLGSLTPLWNTQIERMNWITYWKNIS